jgi:hypothetical protein
MFQMDDHANHGSVAVLSGPRCVERSRVVARMRDYGGAAASYQTVTGPEAYRKHNGRDGKPQPKHRWRQNLSKFAELTN